MKRTSQGTTRGILLAAMLLVSTLLASCVAFNSDTYGGVQFSATTRSFVFTDGAESLSCPVQEVADGTMPWEQYNSDKFSYDRIGYQNAAGVLNELFNQLKASTGTATILKTGGEISTGLNLWKCADGSRWVANSHYTVLRPGQICVLPGGNYAENANGELRFVYPFGYETVLTDERSFDGLYFTRVDDLDWAMAGNACQVRQATGG